MRWIVPSLLLAAGIVTACDKSSPPPAAVTPAPVPGRHQFPTHAQGKLQSIHLWIGPEIMDTEVALTPIQEETGMMFRTNMPENTGMLFRLVDGPTHASFWMKNTVLPLSAAYIEPDGTIAEIHDLKPLDETPVVAESGNIMYVLEVNQGWFKRHNIATNILVKSEYGPLSQTFVTHAR